MANKTISKKLGLGVTHQKWKNYKMTISCPWSAALWKILQFSALRILFSLPFHSVPLSTFTVSLPWCWWHLSKEPSKIYAGAGENSLEQVENSSQRQKGGFSIIQQFTTMSFWWRGKQVHLSVYLLTQCYSKKREKIFRVSLWLLSCLFLSVSCSSRPFFFLDKKSPLSTHPIFCFCQV